MIRIDIVITIALPLSFCYNKDKPRGCTPRVLLAITYACEAWVFAFLFALILSRLLQDQLPLLCKLGFLRLAFQPISDNLPCSF